MEGRVMEKTENNCLQHTPQKCLSVFSSLWLGAALIGALLFYTLKLPTETLFPQYFETFPENLSLSLFRKDLWLFLISSVKQDILFILLLSILRFLHSGICIACSAFLVRGLLFGIGGSLLIAQMTFPVFGTVILRQILLTAAFLFFATSLFSKSSFNEKKSHSSMEFFLFSTFCEIGVSLLIQYLFLFVLIKNQWI